MILRLLILLVLSVIANGAPHPSVDVTFDNYKEEMGFRFSGMTAKKVLGGLWTTSSPSTAIFGTT